MKDIHECLDYEIRSSWWAKYVGIKWMQEIAGWYFAKKSSRKFARYKNSKLWEYKIKNNI